VLTAAARESLGMGRGARARSPTRRWACGRSATASRIRIFLTQLRAILRASESHGAHPVPMLAHAHEIEQALGLRRARQGTVEGTEAQVRRTGAAGGMIEVPAAALCVRSSSRS